MRPVQKASLKYATVLAAGSVFAAVAGQQVGCSSDSRSPGGAPSTSAADGTLGMSLTIPGGELLSTVSYTITGPNGASTLVAQGVVNVQNSLALNFEVGGIPSGTGYTIALAGTTTDGLSTCSGSATFSVSSRTTTNVTANLLCAQGVPDAGSVAVGGQLYACANANFVTAIPSETAVGTAVSLTGAANGPNAAALTYTWSAPTGAFSAPNAASTSFTCTSPGPVTVTLTVSDGPVPATASCNPATASTTVQIVCDPAMDAGAPDATVGSDGGSVACSLGANGAIKHVIYVQFDNTHLSQDEPNVASDLMQMPHLLGFIRGNGTMMANDHTILISHTGAGILSTLTGLYPDRHGQTVANSYVRTSATGSFSFPSTFQYWSNTVATGIYNLTQPDGTNTPAPWIPYTKAGCNFGAIAAADMELENVSTSATGDITNVFGSGSPQWNEAKTNSAKAVTDFEGVAVHCAQGSPICASGEADNLPASQNYSGFQALFGTQQINPLLVGTAPDGGTAPVIDLLGNPITDSAGNPGFPGFGVITAAQTLAYIASMQEHGIPVTFAYISDEHDNHAPGGTAYGPGQPGYEQQLANYDQAFANFFTRLAADGINQSNTLFVFTVDEGDQFVGTSPSPSTCDGGAGNYCSYTLPDGGGGLGEVNVNIDLLVSAEAPSLASNFVMGNRTNPGAPYDFTVHGDDAPTFYLSRVQAGDAGQATGPLAQTDPMTRSFERSAAGFTLVNPYTGNTDNLLFQMADQAGMQALHMMVAADPARNPTFVYFANDTYYITDYPTSTPADAIEPGYAWNHGDDQSIIGQTWLGFVGPGVVSQNNGPDQTVFTDHTDVRPTMLSILGLQDSYVSDGRVITQALLPSDYSPSLGADVTTVQALGDAYKQINSPFDVFPQCILSTSTIALQASDATYASLESQIATLTSQRDALATTIKNALNGAEFGNAVISSANAASWISQAQSLTASCNALLQSAQASDAGASDAPSGG
jgi:hypothetical protein